VFRCLGIGQLPSTIGRRSTASSRHRSWRSPRTSRKIAGALGGSCQVFRVADPAFLAGSRPASQGQYRAKEDTRLAGPDGRPRTATAWLCQRLALGGTAMKVCEQGHNADEGRTTPGADSATNSPEGATLRCSAPFTRPEAASSASRRGLGSPPSPDGNWALMTSRISSPASRVDCGEVSGRRRHAPCHELHRERLAVPRVDRAHIQAFEVRDTGVCGCGIIHKGVEGWPFRVLKEITAEQFPACGQDAYGPPGMPRQGDYFGLEAVLRAFDPPVSIKTWPAAVWIR